MKSKVSFNCSLIALFESKLHQEEIEHEMFKTDDAIKMFLKDADMLQQKVGMERLG
jgi:hypothetical protein